VSADAGGSWHPLGNLTSGPPLSLVTDTSSAPIWYAAAADDLYKSSDGGTTWRSIGAQGLDDCSLYTASCGITNLVVDPVPLPSSSAAAQPTAPVLADVLSDVGYRSANRSGIGQADALSPDGTMNAPSNPAPTGSPVTVFLTGVGVADPACPLGDMAGGASTIAVQGFPGLASISGSVSRLFQMTIAAPTYATVFTLGGSQVTIAVKEKPLGAAITSVHEAAAICEEKRLSESVHCGLWRHLPLMMDSWRQCNPNSPFSPISRRFARGRANTWKKAR
jgi:hypothetical protein